MPKFKIDSSIKSETLNQNQNQLILMKKMKYYESKLNELNDKIILIEKKIRRN